MTAPLPPTNGERRQINWPLVVAFVGWGGFGLIAWGSLGQQVAGHDKRLDKIESAYVSDRDMTAMTASLAVRLSRIEGQLDRLESAIRRPAP